GELDALHVARVVELVVEAVGEADRAPRVRGELTADEALGAAGVEREGGTMLCFGGTHGIMDYGRPLAAKSTRLGRRSSLRAERIVAEAVERRAFRGQRREHGLCAVKANPAVERREQRAERLPPRPRLARRLHRRAEPLHAPRVAPAGAG